MDWSVVVDDLAKFGGLLVFVGGIFTLVFKQHLKAKLEHLVSSQLQQQRADLEKDLERYRIELLSTAEQIKASQQVRTALALKVAEHKFAALTELNAALTGTAAEVLSTASSEPELRTIETYNEAEARLKRLETAIHGASMYFEVDFSRELFILLAQLITILTFCIPENPKKLSPKRTDELLARNKELEKQVRDTIKDLLAVVQT